MQVTTSLGRNLYYGAHYVPLQPDSYVSGYDATEGNIVGLFVDPTTAKRVALKSIGVVYTPQSDRQSERPRSIHLPLADLEPGTFLCRHFRTAFLSQASLLDVQVLRLQRKGSRCTGLYILHRDDYVETLGQWDPSETDAISLVFEASSGKALEALTFVLSENPSPHQRYIEDIYTGQGPDHLSLRRTFTWTKMATVSPLVPKNLGT